MSRPVIFLSTAEFSGDMHGEVLIAELKQIMPEAIFYGIGGPKMAAAGMELLYNSIERSTIGFIEVIKNLGKVKKILKTIVSVWEQRRPDLVIWLDSGGFNLMVAKLAKERGIPVVCMFSPSAWAYGEKRAVKMSERVRMLLAVLPFEAEFYREFGIDARYVGHPLIDRVKNQYSAKEYRERLAMTAAQRLVVLMPGSRRQEISRLLQPMLDAAQELDREFKIKWVLPVAASLDRSWLEGFLKGYPVKVELVSGNTYDLLAAADGAFIASGTATLEAAILNTPMVVVYRITPLSIFIYSLLESKRHKAKSWMIALPNIIIDRRVVPEFIQKELTPQNLVGAMRQILGDQEYNLNIRRELQQVKELIGPPGVMARAAKLIVELIQEKKAKD